MTWFDWLIVIVPIVLLIWVSVYSRKYARGVVDFLAAGRIAGRYVMSVGDMTAGLSVDYARRQGRSSITRPGSR